MTSAAPAAPAPLKGRALVMGTLALSLSTFMTVLDAAIANVSIPAIAGDIGVSPSQGTWVITSFGVANAIAVPLSGWLAQRFGTARMFTVCVLLFVLTSWLCGMSPSLELLVFFRVLQGLAAGPLIPLSQTLLLASYPPSRAGTALGLWGMTTLFAPVVGPVLGGWITDTLSWPWIFFINVPFGLFAASVTWSLYRERETSTRKLPIDSIGLGLLVIWVGALQLMLDKGKELDWFTSPLILALAIVAVIGFAVFLVWELTEAHPIVDLRLFAGRNFSLGVLCISIAYGVYFGTVVLVPLWLQQWMGYTATMAGIAVAPIGLMAIVLSPLVGRKVSVWDPRLMAGCAFLGFAFVLWMRSHFTSDTDLMHVMMPAFLQGAAMGFFFIPLTTLILSGQPPDKMPTAAGLSSFSRIIFGAMGTSITTTLWDERAALHHAQLTEHLSSGQGALASTLERLGGLGLDSQQAMAVINRWVDQQAFTLAADELFLGATFTYVLLFALVWLMRRPAPFKGASAASADGAH